jgi:hypothetical protein
MLRKTQFLKATAYLLCQLVPAPDFQSGGAGFQTRGNVRYINFGALALVAASQTSATVTFWGVTESVPRAGLGFRFCYVGRYFWDNKPTLAL